MCVEGNWKFQLYQDTAIQTNWYGWLVSHPYFDLRPEGLLVVRAGYAWDGASDGLPDTRATLAASLPHDVGAQMQRLGLVSHPKRFKLLNDRWYRKMLLRNGAYRWWAWVQYKAIRSRFADSSVKPTSVKKRRTVVGAYP